MCLSVGARKTRISNWTGDTIELHLKDAAQVTVRVYRVAPKGRKKLRCERARKLCGGSDTLTICVCSHGDPTHTTLTETITGDDLENCAEIKIRQIAGSQTLLLKIPRVQPDRTISHGHSHSRSHSHSYGYSQASSASHTSAGSPAPSIRHLGARRCEPVALDISPSSPEFWLRSHPRASSPLAFTHYGATEIPNSTVMMGMLNVV